LALGFDILIKIKYDINYFSFILNTLMVACAGKFLIVLMIFKNILTSGGGGGAVEVVPHETIYPNETCHEIDVDKDEECYKHTNQEIGCCAIPNEVTHKYKCIPVQREFQFATTHVHHILLHGHEETVEGIHCAMGREKTCGGLHPTKLEDCNQHSDKGHNSCCYMTSDLFHESMCVLAWDVLNMNTTNLLGYNIYCGCGHISAIFWLYFIYIIFVI
jgi:hypothetical protein